jgi:hypothetical protein
MGEITQRLRVRNGGAAAWTAADPVLKVGEVGFETDTGWHKIGDGVTPFSGLIYYHGPPWIQAIDGGSPSSTYVGAPTDDPFPGVMCYAANEPPLDISGVQTVPWVSLRSVGRGPLPNTLVISGTKDTFNQGSDFAIISTLDGSELFFYPNPLVPQHYGSTYQVECDPETGVCVVGCTTYAPGSTTYNSFWTTDFVTFTQNNMNPISGVAGVWFDTNLKMWFCQHFGDTWVSTDGKSWFEQDYTRMPGMAVQGTPQLDDFLHSGMRDPEELDWCYLANHAERGFHVKKQPTPAAPFSQLEFLQDFTIDDANQGVFWGGNPNNPALQSLCTYNGSVYMMTSAGQICKSDTPYAYGTWVAIAAQQANASSSELLDIPFSTWRALNVVNGVFWCCRDSGDPGKWMRYDDGSGNGGEPVGYGWVADNTGPFGDKRIISGQTRSYLKTYPDYRWFAMVYDLQAPPGPRQYVIFDVGLNP